jgi:hypothetical protein
MDRQNRPAHPMPAQPVPPPSWWGPPPPAPIPPPRRRRTGLVAGVVTGAVLTVAAAVLVPVVLLDQPHAAAPAPAAGGAPGSAPAPAPNGILLDIGPGPASGPPRAWGTSPLYDACSLVSQRTIEDQGIALDPQYTVTADNPQAGNSGGTGVTQPNTVTTGSSSCFYPGVNLADTVAVTVFQAPFVTPDAIQNELETNQSGASSSAAVQGFTVYTTNDGNHSILAITNPATPDVLVELDVNLTHPTYRGHTAPDVVAALTNTVITGLRQPPAPASAIRYAARYSGFDPCAIFGATDFATYLGQPDDQHPHAEYQLGERELDTNPGSPHDVVAHYIDTTCQRFSVPLDQGQSTAPGIVAKFEVYRTVAEAQAAMTVTCTPDADPAQDKVDHPFGPPITTLDGKPGKPIMVGTTPACYPRIKAGDWSLTFRSGRTVASVWLWQTIDESKLDQLTPVVAPLAQDLAAKLGTWCRC